jgi:hypothetical protein
MSTSSTFNKDLILEATQGGLMVFDHFLTGRGGYAPERSFRNPFYDDKKASCHLYQDKASGNFRFIDFGDNDYHFDCFGFVGHMFNLNCKDSKDFIEILRIIDRELGLGLQSREDKVSEVLKDMAPKVQRASAVQPLVRLPDLDERITTFTPPQTRPFNESELAYWGQYGITGKTLQAYGVHALDTFKGTTKDGRAYTIHARPSEPIFAYIGQRHAKIYRPFSSHRFQYAGKLADGYCFGLGLLPHRGDILFITGGEKDVLSLASRGFHAICFNSETATIKKSLIRRLNFRFKHIVLLFDMDPTGIKAMETQQEALKEFKVKALALPLPGTKDAKDISDFFAGGGTAEQLMRLFKSLLDVLYADTLSLLRSFEVTLDKPPRQPTAIVSIDDTTIGSTGNIMALTGPEGSGKSNYLGGLLAGTLATTTPPAFDTLGTQICPNHNGRAVLLYDTEQSEAQLFQNLKSIASRAKSAGLPSWFKAYALVGMERKDRLQSILQSMDRLYYEHNGIHLVVIDGIADLLDGVNDEERAVGLIDELYRLAGIYQTCIVCVLHLSPSGYKLRGHLGSEMSRKASGILSIEKDSNTPFSVVKVLKVREGSPLNVPLLMIGWDDEAGHHTLKDTKPGANRDAGRRRDELRSAAEGIFERESSLGYREVLQALSDALGVKDRQAKVYLSQMQKHNIISKSGESPYRYALIPLDSPASP